LGLADAVGAVDGLVFHGRIPPWIVEDDVAGRGQVQARATGLQRDQEHAGLLVLLELAHDVGAILAGAGQPVEGQAHLLQLAAHDFEHGHELAEEQHLVAFLVQLLNEVQRGGQLGAFLACGLGLDQTWVAADLAQAGQGLQQGEAAALQRVLAHGGDDHVLRVSQLVAIHLLLHAAHFAEHVFLGARWQFLGHLALGAAQDEGPQSGRQALRGLLVLAAVEVLLEVAALAQRARGGEGHEAPQIQQAVLHRRAGEHQAVMRHQFARSDRSLAVRVLDLLALIQDRGDPGDALQRLDGAAQLGVVHDQHVDLLA